MKQVKLFLHTVAILRSSYVFTRKATQSPNIYKLTFPFNLVSNMTWNVFFFNNNYVSMGQERKKKKQPPKFKQSRMLLNFIDWSLHVSAKQQAQITGVKKRPQLFFLVDQRATGSLRSQNLADVLSRTGATPGYATVLYISGHQKTLKVLSYTTWGLLAAGHSNKLVGAQRSEKCWSPIASIFILAVCHKMEPVVEF